MTISNMGTLDTNQSAIIRSEVGPKEIGKKARTYRSKGGFNEVKSEWAVFSLCLQFYFAKRELDDVIPFCQSVQRSLVV